MSEKHQIFCFNNGGSTGWMHAVAIADDGYVLGQHICSSEGFMRHDLGMEGSTWKHENYNAHFGEGNWELVWVEHDDPRLDSAIALNKQLPEADKAKEAETAPRVEIEFSKEATP